MPVIALVGNKGGAGKTTLAVNLANALARRVGTVLLDADPQGSALQWRAICEDETKPEVVDAAQDLEAVVANLRETYTHAVIDCPPSVQAPQTLAALRLSDLALIPVQPSPLDLWASVHIERAIEMARETNPGLRAMLVINQLEPRTRLSRLMRQALAEIDLSAAETAIRRRMVYRTSVLEGRSVLDTGRAGEEARAELDQLINEVMTP